MGTRSGDIDPAIMEFIAQKENLDIEGIMNVLNKKSGVFGLSGEISSDFRDLDEAAAKGYIRGYETLVDWEQAGVNLVEAVIELRVTPHKARGFDDIGMTIAQFDEVDTVLLMSGSYDLQVTIKGRSFQEIAIFVAKRLSPLDDVLSTATSFVLRPYKRGGRLYLAEEPDERECTVL